MDIETSVVGTVTVVRLKAPRLDAAQSIRFKENLRGLAETGADHILLDMGEVTFMDSSGLGAVVNVMKLVGSRQRMELAALTPAVAKVFQLTRMDRVFTIHATVADALNAGLKAAG